MCLEVPISKEHTRVFIGSIDAIDSLIAEHSTVVPSRVHAFQPGACLLLAQHDKIHSILGLNLGTATYFNCAYDAQKQETRRAEGAGVNCNPQPKIRGRHAEWD